MESVVVVGVHALALRRDLPLEEAVGVVGRRAAVRADRLLAVDGHEVEAPSRKNAKQKSKAVRELLRDLDTYPKQVHTYF